MSRPGPTAKLELERNCLWTYSGGALFDDSRDPLGLSPSGHSASVKGNIFVLVQHETILSYELQLRFLSLSLSLPLPLFVILLVFLLIQQHAHLPEGVPCSKWLCFAAVSGLGPPVKRGRARGKTEDYSRGLAT